MYYVCVCVTLTLIHTHRSVEHVLVEVREEKGKMEEVCERRDRRWSLSLQLDTLQTDTEKVCDYIIGPGSHAVVVECV